MHTVSLAGNNGEQFRGIFVQARLMSDDTTRVGTFAESASSADDTRLSSCPTNTVSNAAYTIQCHVYYSDTSHGRQN